MRSQDSLSRGGLDPWLKSTKGPPSRALMLTSRDWLMGAGPGKINDYVWSVTIWLIPRTPDRPYWLRLILALWAVLSLPCTTNSRGNSYEIKIWLPGIIQRMKGILKDSLD